MKGLLLNLQPKLVAKPWGGRALSDQSPRLTPEALIGESWEIHGSLPIVGGLWDGHTLDQVTQQLGANLLGRHSAGSQGFPLLTKWLDCQQWLSVQVHPDDEVARRLTGDQGARGKSECWYVHRCEGPGEIVHGLKPSKKTGPELHAEELLKSLNYTRVSQGDFLNTPPGTVHALGPGLLIYEVQQSSDITYRLHDWDRDRELHHSESWTAIKDSKENSFVEDRGQVVGNLEVLTPHFAVESVEQSTHWEIGPESFEIIVSLEREAWCCGEELKPGTAVLLSANFGPVDLYFEGGKCLRIRVP